MKEGDHTQHNKHYQKLMIMVVLSFISMYILMYSMVDAFRNVVPNVNQFYMAGLMSMPMIIIEVLLMRSMYTNGKVNGLIIGVSLAALLGFYFSIRKQLAVDDEQFLKSMIPHHSGAILMCGEANIQDPEVKKLCESIKESQEKEIAEMRAILKRMDK